MPGALIEVSVYILRMKSAHLKVGDLNRPKSWLVLWKQQNLIRAWIIAT